MGSGHTLGQWQGVPSQDFSKAPVDPGPGFLVTAFVGSLFQAPPRASQPLTPTHTHAGVPTHMLKHTHAHTGTHTCTVWWLQGEEAL